MNNRTAARELLVLAIPQLPKSQEKFPTIDFEKLILSSSRSLSDYAKKNLNSVISSLKKMETYLNNVEVDHPDNEERTSQIAPVLIPDTEELKKQIKKLQDASEEIHSALTLPELIVHIDQEATKEYAMQLFKNYIENKDKVNEVIDLAAQQRDKEKKWKIERMVRLDRDILRVATSELLFMEETPVEVICDEAVKIAEKYGGDDSKRFINGVLRDVVFLVRQKTS